jgi:DNA replication protein DnaC
MRPAAAPRDITAREFAAKRRESLAALRVPAKYANETLATVRLYGSKEQQECTALLLRVAQRLVGEYPTWQTVLIAFVGGFGTAKGHVCWSLARSLAEQHAAAIRFVELADMVRDLRAAWNISGEDERKTIRHFRELDVLIINDVSRHAFRGEPMQHLWDILEHRINHGRLTILTSNESDTELHGILGGALWDRLTGWEGGLVDTGQESYRQLSTTERCG